ncbi:di-trans,poly-cis-decaprenylcistransferase [Candidatus Saccharibacteria bacterium]|jgi:undecaprenyl diphosphate synthase|nr:di-trans,poly-cis-decaprenylcistransferase [Candidatus Saccharibacteria bacterium]
MDSNLKVPIHIGYIVDGNRRWAKSHGLPTYEGHMAGYNAIHDVAKATFEAGAEFVSAYIFSTENWKRSEEEVGKLMGLVLRLLTADLPKFTKNNIRLKVLGSREGVDEKIIKAIDNAESQTANNTAGTLALCFNYGGQLEIADACKKIVQSGVAADSITPETIARNLYSPDIPPIDLVVRTSGEQRLSNFMLWRSAYSELLFIDKSWPDMTKEDVSVIMEEYNNRIRRFGK